jgi:hypothetical protein
MITEDYVSFEIAKLLKEKGFDGKCRMIYREHDKQMIYHTPNPDDLLDFETNKRKLEKHSKKQHCDYALCPTHQMALKWLREVYKIHIAVNIGCDVDNKNYVFYTPTIVKLSNKSVEYIESFSEDDNEFDNNEQAVEAAILYVLKNLI